MLMTFICAVIGDGGHYEDNGPAARGELTEAPNAARGQLDCGPY